MSDNPRPDPDQPESTGPESRTDATSEAEAIIGAAASDTFEQAADAAAATTSEQIEPTKEVDEPAPGPEGKLERLQKILARAGIASRRHAEELITEGRVQVNGKVVTELGTKADADRDHIRVDGKLLQGSERLRYFMLNKPKGFVTTVSDPEGRPTIIQFFSKMRERLYPVGRLDYLSEGLLLVTNDGELANKLTRAASGVEKTYLVKVSGEPTEEEIERLRKGVSIDRVKPGSGRVQSAPAHVRKVRRGDNPWYEVVLIEGRNRELRKMFEEIGHHVEKIRRVGYGPLVLDLEPGKLRELESEEVENLRKAAEGKYHKPKARDARKRSAAAAAQLPTVKPHWSPKPSGDARADRTPFRRPESGPERTPNRTTNRAPGRAESGPPRGQFRTPPRSEFRPGARFEGRPPRRDARDASARPFGGTPASPRPFTAGSPREGSRPAWTNKPERGSRPPRFDRNAAVGRGGARPDRSRSNDRRPPGEFRPRPSGERGPQRVGEKRPGPAEGGFSGKKRLEIRPADEQFDRPSTPQDRPERRPFQPRSGPRPGFARGPSAPRLTGKQRPQSGRDRQPDSGPRPRFDRDRAESADRPRLGALAKPQPEGRPTRPPSGPRSGGFNRGGAGGRGKNKGSNRGSIRSRGGRHPGSKPGGKPSRGKRRP